jgi:hypothetical protein
VFVDRPVGKVPVVVNCTACPTAGVACVEAKVNVGEVTAVNVPIDTLMFCPAIKPPNLLLMSIP